MAPFGLVGEVVIEACRLRDADTVRRALTESNSYLIVAITDAFHRDMYSHFHGYPEFSRAKIRVKDFVSIAWLYLSGASAQPLGQPHLLDPAYSHHSWSPADDMHDHESLADNLDDPGSHAEHVDHSGGHASEDHHSEPDLW